jgi:DNA (cytosine-5)-methyltransferase 1
MSRPRLLDLFCGAGGAAMGYHRAGFDVVGVDINPQPHYPFEFHQADALTYPLDGFDAIHASPPCQTYSKSLRHLTKKSIGKWEGLLEETRERLAGTVHVIENVPGAPIADQAAFWGLSGVMLCGSYFGLGIETPNGWREVRRHRLFESSVSLTHSPGCRHRFLSINPYNTLARHRDGLRQSEADRALIVGMGIDWHTTADQGREAIPPAYTEWIGAQLLRAIEAAA